MSILFYKFLVTFFLTYTQSSLTMRLGVIKVRFGDRVRQRREQLKISRKELADKVGVTASAIGNYENGVSSPKEEVLLALFDALGVDANFLFQDSIKKASVSLDTEADEINDIAYGIYKALLDNGFIKDGQELSLAQSELLDGLSSIIAAFFNKSDD